MREFPENPMKSYVFNKNTMTISTKIYQMGFSENVKKICLILPYVSVILRLNNGDSFVMFSS